MGAAAVAGDGAHGSDGAGDPENAGAHGSGGAGSERGLGGGIHSLGSLGERASAGGKGRKKRGTGEDSSGDLGARGQAGAQGAGSPGASVGGRRGKKRGADVRVVRGRLVGLKDGEIHVLDEAGNVSVIPQNNAASVKRAIVFD
jgi:hypothetical protein